MPPKVLKLSRSHDKLLKNSSVTQKVEPPAKPPTNKGRKTNNSLASATGKIFIPDNDEPVHSNLKKWKTSQIFQHSEEDIQTDMYKVLEQLTAHDDAWPFIDPVEEEYAPNYYTVIRRPMDLRKMQERLDNGYYTDFSMFKSDFKLIVNNCRLYNGQDNEYTKMVDNLQLAFDRLTQKYMHKLSSSDEEISVEYRLSMPRRQHKRKFIESSIKKKRKMRKFHSEPGDGENNTLTPNETGTEPKKKKGLHRNKEENFKKKRRSHYRNRKSSKILRKDSYISGNSDSRKHINETKEAKKEKKNTLNNHNRSVSVIPSLKQSELLQSLSSSNCSRSASPLPSIQTPPPSPTELDPPKLQDSDFFKGRNKKNAQQMRDADKVESRGRESVFDYKHKTVDRTKQNFKISNKDKNQKLRETIEKLRAKSEKDSSIFYNQITSNRHSAWNYSDMNIKEYSNNKGGDLDLFEYISCGNKKNTNDKNEKQNCTAKNESASEALEQAVKDISKWLDDVPEGPTESSTCDRFAYIISTERHDTNRKDDELSEMDRSLHARKDISRKRPSSLEPKILSKRRDIHRTIDRLQPGKSKGNLLTIICNKNTAKAEEITLPGTFCKVRRKGEETSPKLSLGSVLQTVEFSFGKDVKFLNDEDKPEGLKETPKKSCDVANFFAPEVDSNKKYDVYRLKPTKKDSKIVTDPIMSVQPSQENATPNLSAWFKAFGVPKTTASIIMANKNKPEESKPDDKPSEININESKSSCQKTTAKYDSLTDPETRNPDELDSPLPNTTTTPRQRRISTGSSVSERSSFSQDLDSPRHQLSHTSPLLQSPASPYIDDVQKITYPIINGTIRAGFYQDTNCIKSSPEKSCSPRGAPLSAFSPYSQHKYAPNYATAHNYFNEHNKSPLITYFVNDTTEAPAANKSDHSHEDYIPLVTDSCQHNECSPYSAAHSPHLQSQTTTHYNQAQNSPQTTTSESVSLAININATPTLFNKKNLTPVKKRLYSEYDLIAMKIAQENIGMKPKYDYQMTIPSLHTIPSFQATSVDDTKSESKTKSELAELQSLRGNSREDTDRHALDKSEVPDYEIISHDTKKLPRVDSKQAVGIVKKDNVDMINMGYMNPDSNQRNETNRDIHEQTHTLQIESYEVGSFAINLGIINQQIQKSIPKSSISSDVHERSSFESVNLAHVCHSQYESICNRQSSNFSLSDIELANKKIYGCNTVQSPAAHDYGSWKTSHQTCKQDVLPHFSSYNINTDKSEITSSEHKSAINNENKSIHTQQYNNSNISNKTSLLRARELHNNLQYELRIQASRGLVQNDVNDFSSVSDSNLVSKNLKSIAKSKSNADIFLQNQRLVGSVPYKISHSTHSTLPLNSLRNLPKIPQMLKKYTKDDTCISNLTGSDCSLYQDKNYQITQMLNKFMSSDVQPSSAFRINPESATMINKNDSINNKINPNVVAAVDTKCKRKRNSDLKPISGQFYQNPCSEDVLSSVKTSLMPASSFGFGGSTNTALGGGLYADNIGFSIEDFRSSTRNQLMAANYMAAAVALQQRNNVEANFVKFMKSARHNPSHVSSSFPQSQSQVRDGYPFVSANSSSPLYQQYLQRHREPFLGHTGAQIMSVYPSGYPTGLGGHQPYDTKNLPSWL